MNHKYLNIIGLMTGTSMDGIDISFVKTNGTDLIRLNKNYFYKYESNTREFLLSILKEDININLRRKKYLDEFVTNLHYLALKNLGILKSSDLVGFHGQTIYHNPCDGISVQLGEPKLLSKMLNKNVVFDFRANDLASGGQGAPLAPIFHKLIIEKYKLKLPSCIINIGGISNLTYWDGQKLIGFDTGPGNALMDDFCAANFKKEFDKNGFFASKGVPIKKEINEFLQHNYFKKLPPKSLDKLSFADSYNKLIKKKYSLHDTMATLSEFTVQSILRSFEYLPKKVNNIVISGGGFKNIHLMNCLEDRLKLKITSEKELGLDFDFIESELIAFLSARSIYKLPFTFPLTTGVCEPLSGGKLYNYL